ncbi:MAG TPA: cytochrome c [Thiobacillaceae bacterium]|nr:cytochrome c [Thiobacillaceae bacterium]
MNGKWMIVMALGAASAMACAADKVDVKRGQTLVEKKCMSCHVSMYGGDGSKIYLRPDHKVKNYAQLASRVAWCNTNTGAGWFPDEEADVTAYLNQKYYKFK